MRMPKSKNPKTASITLKCSGHVSGDLENLIHMDASNLMNYFNQAYEEVNQNVTKPNVLITGVTGAGKSSIVNTVFGVSLAQVGSGKPITQHFTRYEFPDKNVIVYDSKGLEHGEHQSFLKDTQQFFEEHEISKKGDSSNCIHVIWYVINSAGARFQPFEEDLCKNVFDIPIIFILSKADVSTKEERMQMRAVLEELQLPRVVGIFETISAEFASQKLKRLDNCPKCGSDDLLLNRKQKHATCEECGHKEDLHLSTGLEEVVKATVHILPKVAREAFISAQRISFELKERRARRIITDFVADHEKVHLASGLLKILAKMITRLSILWEFRAHGHLYGLEIAKEIVGGYSFRDKVFLFMHKDKHQINAGVSLGVLWNRCVRALATRLFHDTFECNISPEEEEKQWSRMMEEIFSDLNDDELEKMREQLNEVDLDTVLEAEMPGCSKSDRQKKRPV